MEKKNIISGRDKVIEIKELYKSFGNYHVLKGVDLDLYNRENLVVLSVDGIPNELTLANNLASA
ncbi:MAG: hypothetical protein EOO89_24155, partial [Pedobacter sp.]